MHSQSHQGVQLTKGQIMSKYLHSLLPLAAALALSGALAAPAVAAPEAQSVTCELSHVPGYADWASILNGGSYRFAGDITCHGGRAGLVNYSVLSPDGAAGAMHAYISAYVQADTAAAILTGQITITDGALEGYVVDYGPVGPYAWTGSPATATYVNKACGFCVSVRHGGQSGGAYDAGVLQIGTSAPLQAGSIEVTGTLHIVSAFWA
jgi:hypothetical protein